MVTGQLFYVHIMSKYKKSTCFKWTYLFGKNYRVVTLSTLYLTNLWIISGFKIDRTIIACLNLCYFLIIYLDKAVNPQLTDIIISSAQLTDIMMSALQLTNIMISAAQLKNIMMSAAQLTNFMMSATQITNIMMSAAQLTDTISAFD